MIENKDPEILIGYLHFNDISVYTEGGLGQLKLQGSADTVIVEVRTNEGWEKPHMHLYNDDFHCAIRLDIPEYFIHGPWKDTLNTKQQKIFHNFMSQKKPNKKETNWEYGSGLFNDKFSPHNLITSVQPNYTLLGAKKLYYRIICKGEGGIYEAYKNSVSQNSWEDFLESKDVNWLPKPKLYGPAYESYFTEKGYSKFCGTTINLIRKNIENGSSFLNEKFFITIAKEITDSKILYKDEYQVIIKY